MIEDILRKYLNNLKTSKNKNDYFLLMLFELNFMYIEYNVQDIENYFRENGIRLYVKEYDNKVKELLAGAKDEDVMKAIMPVLSHHLFSNDEIKTAVL